MKLVSAGQWIAGFLLSGLLSPLSPVVTVPLLKFLVHLHLATEETGMPNSWFLFILGFISLVIPAIGFILLRKRYHTFAWGLLVGLLVLGVSGYALVLGTVLFVNY